ncbi:MAG: signal peptidase I [Sedimentisphaerales bacterium]|nr:signal peptidase I [Sedimentisphaerales bacterium]
MNENEAIDQAQSQTKDHKRHPWLAVLLSLLMPGLGHIYCGKIKAGVAIMFIITFLPMQWILGTIKGNEVVVGFTLLYAGVVLLAEFVAAVDACRVACRSEAYVLKDYNHWTVYVLLLLINTGASFGYAGFLKDRIVQAFVVPTHSMYPTIQSGDRILASKQAYVNADPKRGDIVLFPNPQDRKQVYVKRVVALAGDTVEVRDDRLIINGTLLPLEPADGETPSLPEPVATGRIFWEKNGTSKYRIFLGEPKDGKARTGSDFGPIVVPTYHCFVMGDNRNLSSDSRHFGPVALTGIRGKFNYLYFPANDWSRLGPLE